MRRAGSGVLLGAVAIAVAGCGGSRTPAVAPSGVGVLHSPHSSAALEIQAAHGSNADLFRIFPTRLGSRPCAIPSGAGLVRNSIAGICETSVSYPVTHGRFPEAFVRFRERWGARHSSAWTVIVQWPAERVVATELHGEMSPQMRYAATD